MMPGGLNQTTSRLKNMKNNFKVIGLMSGTSLDGLDIACCDFSATESGWRYRIENAETIRYSTTWTSRLSTAHKLSSEELLALDSLYGTFLGDTCKNFINRHKIKADFIASHGHTVFHQPRRRFTYQLGNGNALHAASSLPVVYDFRSLDVMLGGEGAPLVPAGDKYLFSEYDVCLNLGGIANLSMDTNQTRLAFDVCFCNMPLNQLMAQVGKKFDKGGALAATGEVHPPLLSQLSKLYKKLYKKRPSLGRELFEEQVLPLLKGKKISLEDKLRTLIESTSREIIYAMQSSERDLSILCTGGGAFNSFLLSRLVEFGGDSRMFILPEEEVIKFKEALVFAFLGVLRISGQNNCLASVTGAKRDSSGGVTVGF
jgi:anhydro-N-acetylmuramic acid kinase